MSKIQSPAKIACIQMRISYCRVEENLAEADRLIEAACANGATLLILPETFTTGSAFDTRAEAYAVAEAIPDGRTSQFLLKKAREHGVYITGSFVERDGADLYNTAVLAGPDGLVGKFRKLHPFVWMPIIRSASASVHFRAQILSARCSTHTTSRKAVGFRTLTQRWQVFYVWQMRCPTMFLSLAAMR